MTPLYDVRKKVELYALLILILIALGYGAFRAYPLLMGPTITLYAPQDGDTVASSTFQISGQVVRAREITLQGKLITIDAEGRFVELLVANSPYTIIVMVATDQYGAKVMKTLRVVPN
ncbi:MAG: hypothetical protein WC444_03515 [Candidatus Paceibacterota bacterium]